VSTTGAACSRYVCDQVMYVVGCPAIMATQLIFIYSLHCPTLLDEDVVNA
jgi:hypothetical protein